MKTLKIDLNKLDDNELEMYLALKKKQVEDTPTTNRPIGTKSKISAEDIKSLEEFLIKEPRSVSQMFKQLNMDNNGRSYKKIIPFLKKAYKGRLSAVKSGKRTYYQIIDKEKEKKRPMIFWTENMTKDILELKGRGLTHKQIKDELNAKYGINLSVHKVEMKLYNLRKKGIYPSTNRPFFI